MTWLDWLAVALLALIPIRLTIDVIRRRRKGGQ